MWPFGKSSKRYECSTKHLFIFLAGAATLHTLNLVYLIVTSTPPIYYFGVKQTSTLIAIAIAQGCLLAAFLLWQVSHKTCDE